MVRPLKLRIRKPTLGASREERISTAKQSASGKTKAQPLDGGRVGGGRVEYNNEQRQDRQDPRSGTTTTTTTALSASENNDRRDSPVLHAPSGANRSLAFADGNIRRKSRSLFRSKPGRQPKVKQSGTISAMSPSQSPPNTKSNNNIDRIELVAMKNNENRSIVRIIVGKPPRKQKKGEGIEKVSGVQANGGNACNSKQQLFSSKRFGTTKLALCGNLDQMRSPVILDHLSNSNS